MEEKQNSERILNNIMQEIAAKKDVFDKQLVQKFKAQSGAAKSTVVDSPLPEEGFNVWITATPPKSGYQVSSQFKLTVKVKNLSSVIWPASSSDSSKFRINLSYHWLTKDKKIFSSPASELRTPLPHDVYPYQEVAIDAVIKAPYMSGEYLLEFDMVQEAVSWFRLKGSKTTMMPVQIKRIII